MTPTVVIDLVQAGRHPRGWPVEVAAVFRVDGATVHAWSRICRPEKAAQVRVPPFTYSQRSHGISGSTVLSDGVPEADAAAELGDLMTRFGRKYGGLQWVCWDSERVPPWLSWREPWMLRDPDAVVGEGPIGPRRALDRAQWVAGQLRDWRRVLDEARRQVAYAEPTNWRAALDRGADLLRAAGAPEVAYRQLVDAADGFTVQTGRKDDVMAAVLRRGRGDG